MANILIVEDDLAIRKMFARALSQLGTIDEAAGGIPAVELLAQKKYDAILLDLHMAGLDGNGVLDELEKSPGPNRHSPVFVITADPSADSRAQAIGRSRFYLQKPVKITVLVTLVAGVLGKSAKDASPNRPTK